MSVLYVSAPLLGMASLLMACAHLRLHIDSRLSRLPGLPSFPPDSSPHGSQRDFLNVSQMDDASFKTFYGFLLKGLLEGAHSLRDHIQSHPHLLLCSADSFFRAVAWGCLTLPLSTLFPKKCFHDPEYIGI